MQDSGIIHVEPILLLLVLLVAGLAVLAKRLNIAYPIVMVIGGSFMSLVPHAPQVSLDPDVVFLIILPPLLFSAAFHTSWGEFRRNLVSIVMLAFGLVGFTIWGVAGAARVLLPGFDWHLGLVLGAVVAATDAIAATATAKRLGLPRRITALLEAESLVNDGSGLVALRFTLAMVMTGMTPSIASGVWTLFYLVSMGIVIGLAVAVGVRALQRRIVDAPVEITVSLVTPYIAYLAAESAHCSGVLATLACGIYLGRRSSGFYSLHARIEASAVWNTLDFVLNGVVFLVLGLQLPRILADIRGTSRNELIAAGAMLSAVVILLRMIWMFPGAWISARIQQLLTGRQTEPVPPKRVFLVGWAGMRGVLALAAALSLPERLDNGAPFPQRNMIIFLTFCVIFATLVLQGLSMPFLIRRLGLAEAAGGQREEMWARRQMINAALEELRGIRAREQDEHDAALDQLEDYYRRRLLMLESGGDGLREHAALQADRFRSIAQDLRDTERLFAQRLRDENKIHDEVLRSLEYELDLMDARYVQPEG